MCVLSDRLVWKRDIHSLFWALMHIHLPHLTKILIALYYIANTFAVFLSCLKFWMTNQETNKLT